MSRLLILAAALLAAWPAPAQTPLFRVTATTDNVAGAPDSIRIDVQRWSTDAERDRLLAAWNLTAPPEDGRGGRGGRGRAPAIDPAPDPAAVDAEVPRPAAGRGGRGGRAGGRSGAAEVPRATPESSLKAALGMAPIVGHLWSSEVAGYALRSALRLAQQDGSERIILITDRRLGAWNDLWRPAGTSPETTYPFSVIELRLDPKGAGEGKLSLTGKVTADRAAKTVALEDYPGLPVVLKNVRRK